MSTFFIRTLCFVQLLAALPLLAQGTYVPRYLRTEAFGGFSTAGLEPGRRADQGLDRLRFNGWTAGLTSYEWFRRWGLTAEFSRRNRDSSGFEADNQTILFGGTFRALDRSRLALTGRIVAGIDRWNPRTAIDNGYRRQNSFAFGFGQAIDVKFNDFVALRVRPELLFVRREKLDGSRRTELVNPLSVGLVIKFGNR